jgi:transcription antitermination factor NusG
LAEIRAGEMAAEKQISWGVAHTTAYGFGLARDELREMGFPVFAPRVRTTEVRHFGRAKALRRAIERPLFRGYVFVGWAAGSDDWAAVVDARGVVDLLRSCGKLSAPSLVPPALMAAMMNVGELIDLTLKRDVREREEFKRGDVVRVNRPAFEDQIWRVARLDGRARIRFILQSCRPGFEKVELKASAEDLVKVEA